MQHSSKSNAGTSSSGARRFCSRCRTKAEEAGIKRERLDRPQEDEDDAQKLTNLELGGNLVVRIRKRLAIVERALKKLEGGTYGLSDVSGRSIPRERLEAIPEAICTLEEEGALEHLGYVG